MYNWWGILVLSPQFAPLVKFIEPNSACMSKAVLWYLEEKNNLEPLLQNILLKIPGSQATS